MYIKIMQEEEEREEEEEEPFTVFHPPGELWGVGGSEMNYPTKRHVEEDNPAFVHVQPPGSRSPPSSPMDLPLAGAAAEGGPRLMLLVIE